MPLQIATLTPNAVQQSLQNNGLAALGLTTVALGTRWADADPALADYDSAALSLDLAGGVRAPFLGIRENAFTDASSTIAVDLPNTDAATTIVLATGTGASFPAPTGGGR